MRSWKFLLPLLASTLCFAQQPDRITGSVDSSQMVALPGHINRRALPKYDQGPVEPSFLFAYVTLVVAPSPNQQISLEQLLAQQQDRRSPNYHRWLTPQQYAGRFGLNQKDVDKITVWLESQGLQIVSVGGGRNSVNFSGTAAQIESAFKTEIHRYDANGEKHIAPSTPIEIPAALSGVVTRVRGLTDFLPKPMYVRPVRGGKGPGPHPSYTTTIDGTTEYFLAPGDIATIYDINPLYSASPAIDGTGQQLAIIGQTDVYLADINDFRSGFGLNPITGCTTNTSGVVTACSSTNFQYVVAPGIADPGTPSTCGDLPEADLDIEWSGATARNAQIIFVNSPVIWNSDCTSGSGGGVNAALAYAIDPPSGSPLAPVISMSYGLCEAEAESLETELQQGNAEGVTVMNSSGDQGAAACDNDPPNDATNPPFDPAIGGLSVNYPASSPEVTGVGGTSIPSSDYTGAFWSASNGNFGVSALTSLEGQEVSWNDDAAFAQFCQTDSSNTFCVNGGPPAVPGWVDITSAATAQEDVWISAGGGGVSNCFGETAEGICTNGFPLPTWQQSLTIPGLTSPQSAYRFVPDVSLLASPNYPGYVFCTPQNQWVSGSTSTVSTCGSGISTAVDTYFSLVGGTSASTPVFAGIVTLLNQYLGSGGLGNINPTLYTLASTPPNGAFHKITSGDNDAYCQAGTPSLQPSDVICPSASVFGFSASNSDATTGYNLVAGLGSVDADNLAIAWAATLAPDFQLTASALTPSSVPAGQTATATLTISPIAGSVGTVVNFAPSGCSGLPAGATCKFSQPSVNFDGVDPVTITVTISTLANMTPPPAAQTITITPTGSPNTSTTVSLTVTATNQSFTLTTTASTFPIAAGGTVQVPITVVGVGSPLSFVTSSTTALPLTYACTGTPSLGTAEISCLFSPSAGESVSAAGVTLNLATTAPTTGQLRPPLGRGSRIFYALLLPGLFGIVFAAGRRPRGLRLLSLIVALGFSMLWLGSCGGSGTNSNIPPNPGTPAGTYTVSISATTGGAVPVTNNSAPLTITLNVTATQ